MPPLLGSSALKAEPSPKCWYHPQGWQEPVPPQLLEGAACSNRQHAHIPHCAWELLQECVCFRELSAHLASVCAASSSLLFRTLVARALTLLWKDPQSGTLSSSPFVSRTAQVLSIHLSVRWIFHWISHNLFHIRGKPPNMEQTLCWAVVPLWE